MDESKVPFGIDDSGVVEAFSRLPVGCKECPEVLELLAGLAYSSMRADLGDRAAENALFVKAVASRGISFIARVSEQQECGGTQDNPPSDDGKLQTTKKFCPAQWLINEANSAVHYGVDPAGLKASFLELDKPKAGFEAPEPKE